MGLFKTKVNSELAQAGKVLNRWCSPLSGSDSNEGVSELAPSATLSRANSAYNVVLLNGKATENITGFISGYILGDNEAAEIDGVCQTYAGMINLKVRALDVSGRPAMAINCRIGLVNGMASQCNFRNCFIETVFIGIVGGVGFGESFINNTVLEFKNRTNSSTKNLIVNTIFVQYIDLYNYSSTSNLINFPIFKYCLFRKATIWKWNGATIPINWGTYGNAAGDYMADVISGLYAFANSMVAGQDKNYFLAMIPSANSSNIFYVDVNGQTCKVVEDRPSIPGSKKIFNRYVNDSPVDYSLFLSSDNVALTMSDKLGHVGCYKANAKVLAFGEVMHVNADGSDDLVTVPDMLISDGNGKFHVSTADSIQIRNRVRSDVFSFKRGFNLTAFQSQIKSGLGSRFSMGKFQPYNITDAPTLPQESIEILPYDDAVTPSAFPRFSGMFNGECKMWYHNTGAKINQPVLFNDLQSFFAITTDKSLAEYGTWAVTNADFETYLLSSKTGVALRNIPVYYGRIELNLNYHI